METTIEPKSFIKVWQNSDTPDEVAKKFESKKEKMSALASIYRKKGIPLKRMKKGPKLFDNIDVLVEYAKKLETKN